MMDYTVGDTIRKCFTTRAFATGIPTVLSGTPVLSVYEDDSITQITAGVSVTVDLDGVVGLNQLVIVATGGNGFNTGSDYSVVVTTGTVSSVSVVGEVVYTFSLGRSAAAVDLANATDGLGALSTDIADVPTVSEFDARTLIAASYFDPTADTVANVTLVATTTTNTDMRGTDSAALASVATEARLSELDAANLPTTTDATLVDTGTTIPAQITALNDVAATDIVSAGAITTSSGAVSNVTLVATTTANTDMRGTDSAATATNLATVDTNVDAILVDTGTTLPAQITALNNISVSDVLTTQMTESFSADGVAPTLTQALFLIQQMLGDFVISGTTLTIRQIDGTTTAATFTLDSSTIPTSLTRAS